MSLETQIGLLATRAGQEDKAIRLLTGTLLNLTTTVKTDVVTALNEVDADVGAPASLTTTAKGSTVAAINELDAEIGAAALTTTAQTLAGGINELDAEIGIAALTTTAAAVKAAINELDAEIGAAALTTTAATLAGGINELDAEIGVLSTLTTTAKNTLVAAINENAAAIGGAGASIVDTGDYTGTGTSAGSVWSSTKTSTEIQGGLASLVDAAPDLLNTINELAAALQDDPAVISSLQTLVTNNATAITNLTNGQVATNATDISNLTTAVGNTAADFVATFNAALV